MHDTEIYEACTDSDRRYQVCCDTKEERPILAVSSDAPAYDVAEEFAWLHAYSPYHHVVKGKRYPAVLLMTGAGYATSTAAKYLTGTLI